MRIATTLVALSRFHIVLIAAGGSLVFGWLLTGHFWPGLAALVAVDWFLVNLVNRVVDRVEDERNGIEGTAAAWAHRRAIVAGAAALYVASFAVHLVVWPWLALPRLAYHLLGLVYNVRLLPTRLARPDGGRRTRLKELYFFKNTASCLGFLLTLFVYPLVALPLREGISALYVALLVAYFAPFEYSFEVIYDLRDIEGDRVAGVRSYPVVHGPVWAGRLVLVLGIVALHVPLWGAATGVFGLREAILAVAPLVQLGLFAHAFGHGLTARHCIAITWAFAAMLGGYTAWVLAGMPVALPGTLAPTLVVEIGLVVTGVALWTSLRSTFGDGRYLALYVVVAASAWLGEQTSITLYRFYGYSSDWHVFLGDVPLAVVLIWPMVVLSVAHIVRRMGFAGWSAAWAGAVLVLFEALLVEVACVQARLWWWEGQGIFGVPIIGVLGWAAFGWAGLVAVERLAGARLLALPVLGFVVVHGTLVALWNAGFRAISYTALPAGAVLGVIGAVSLAASVLALSVRRRLGIGIVEVWPRILAAELIFYLLLDARPSLESAALCLLFPAPYLALFTWSFGAASASVRPPRATIPSDPSGGLPCAPSP